MTKIKTLVLGLMLAAPVAGFCAGAIAVDDERGETDPGYGVVVGADSREQAGREAMKECRAHGNDNCQVVVRFDKCGAYASSKTYYGAGWGATKREAVDMAMSQCGRDSCELRVAECE